MTVNSTLIFFLKEIIFKKTIYSNNVIKKNFIRIFFLKYLATLNIGLDLKYNVCLGHKKINI